MTTQQMEQIQSTQEINDASYFQYQQGLFYGLLNESLLSWVQQIKCAAGTIASASSDPNLQIRSFIDTWCYALYQRGIKRRIVTYGSDLPDFSSIASVDELPNIAELRAQGVIGSSLEQDAAYLSAAKSGNAFQRVFYGRTSSALLQFYYDKSANGFNKTDPLTMFCRHLVFDLNSMSIVSIGLPGALSYDTFNTSIGSDGVSIEEYLEGTMVVYNQRLAQFGLQSVSAQQLDTDEQMLSTPGDKKPQNDWALSTRRKLGTSFFNNPGKSFDQMFRENNQSAGTEFGDIDYLADKVLVFNIEHAENRVVNPVITNRNTIVACYQLPADFNLVRASVSNLLNVVFNVGTQGQDQVEPVTVCDDNDGASLPVSENTETIEKKLADLLYQTVMGHAAVCEIRQILVSNVINDLTVQGVKGLRAPTRLFVYHGTNPQTVIQSMITNMDQYMAGVILKTAGETRRTKVRNPAHYELLKIKGSGPITISDRNKHNLFKVYWNLRQRGPDAIQQFLDVFDNKSATYKNIFTWYDILISGMNHQLFQEYHNVFVRKSMPAQAISYAFKPLCGELHKIYKAEHKPITRDSVIQFVVKLEHNQVYWRLFGIDA